MNSRIKWIVALVMVLAALATAVYFMRWRNPAPSVPIRGGRAGLNQPVAVRTATARTGTIDVVLEALGTVSARNTAIVHTRVDGLLQKINFQEGREVTAGAVLAEIDPRPFDAALAQAEGPLARDEALLAAAKSDLDRYQTLLTQDSIARQQVDDQASLVHQYAGAVQSDQGNVANARLQRDFTRVTAPIAGRAGLRQVDVGNMVHAADPNGLVVLTETRPINVLLAVPADRAGEIIRRWSAGTTLKVEAYDRDDKTLLATGRLESTDNQIDSATGTVKLKATFDNQDGALFPNQFVNARLTLNALENQTLVPVAGIQHGTPGTFVYLLGDDSTVSIRKVAVGITTGDMVAIASGLKSGDKIVIEGTDKLRDGAKVQPAAEAPAPDATHRKGSGPAAKGAWPGGKHRSTAASNP